MQQYSTVASRNLILAERTMLKAAEPIKVLSTFGEQYEMPQNKTDTVVFRRPRPLDAGTNGAPQVTASDYLLSEGVTPAARSIEYDDVQCTVQQYGVLMKLSAKAESLYEDDIPKDMMSRVGQHMGTLEELIAYGVVRGGTNVVFGNGSQRNQVTTVISLPKLRQIARVIEAAHGQRVTEKLSAGVDFGTSAVHPAYLVFVHTDVEADIRNLPGFTPVVEYGTQKPVHDREIGAVEQFRFVTSPYFRPFIQAGGTNATAGAVLSNGIANTGANASDIYPVMVVGREAWSQVAVKGMGTIDPTYLPAKAKNHANPMGQFGYVGATFWKTALRLNENWMCRLEVAVSAL
jgi:N4-gp56 family major capsid protein